MHYAEKIRDVGPISFEIDDGSSHPTGFGDMKDEGVLFNIVSAVQLPQSRQGMSPDAAQQAYDAERRKSWDILKKIESSLQAIGYEFSHKKGTEWKGEQGDHVAIDEYVAWLQVTKFPQSHQLPDADATVKALENSLPQDQYRDRLTTAIQNTVKAEIENIVVETLNKDINAALDRAVEQSASDRQKGVAVQL